MSRTIRRKRHRKHHTSFSKPYLYTIPDEWNGVRPMYGTVGAFPHVKKEGKEYDQAYHWFHSDRFKVPGWDYDTRRGRWESARAYNKRELIRWIQNPDYEPMMLDYHDDSRYHSYY